jgi:hypothetical protein
MAVSFMTYNFSLNEEKYKKHPQMIYSTLKDKRNGISTSHLIPGMQCYINYMDLLVLLRDKWISTGYLDLGMIPVIVGPSFMHEVLTTALLPSIKSQGLKVVPMPGSSFMLHNSMIGTTDYWAFRTDAADFLGCSPERVTTKAIISKLIGVVLE